VPDTHPLAVECFSLRPGEAVYEFGETFMGLDKTRQTIDLNMVEPLGVSTPRSYKNVPFFVTTHGYGVFLNHSSRITAWVGSLSAVDVQVAVEDDLLDYTVMLGDIKSVLGRYTDSRRPRAEPPKHRYPRNRLIQAGPQTRR
jgi:alpha-D-xyloside xylohydrolase